MPDFPPFWLDTVNQCLWRRRETAPDEQLLLTPKAFAVLRYLVEHAGQLVTQEELLAAVWPETYIKPEVLKSRIFEVRSALGDRPKAPRFIETLARRGYRFIALVHDGPAAAPAPQGGPHAAPPRGPCGGARDVVRVSAPGVAGPATARLCHRRTGHRENRPGRRLPAAGPGGRAGPARGARAMPGGLRRHGSGLPAAGSARRGVPGGGARGG